MELPGFLTTPEDPSANGWRALLPDCTLPEDTLLLWLEAVPDGVRPALWLVVSALRVAVDLLSLLLEDWVVVVVVVLVPRLRVAVTLWELLPEDDDEAGFVVVVVVCLRVAVVVFLSLVLEVLLAGFVVVVVCLRVAVVVLLSGVWEEETLLLLLEERERLAETELRLLELDERLLETLLLLLDELERLAEAELRLLDERLPERLVVLVWVEVPRLRVCASAAGLASIRQAKMAEVKSADSFIMYRFLLSPR